MNSIFILMIGHESEDAFSSLELARKYAKECNQNEFHYPIRIIEERFIDKPGFSVDHEVYTDS